MGDVIVSMEHITKEFPGVKALDDVKFNLRAGEVMALLGENGAGKSTLMKILSGVYSLDQGSLKIFGKDYESLTPSSAREAGVAIIHQELNMCKDLTVAQNMFLGREERKGFVLNNSNMEDIARKYLGELGVDISPDEIVGELPVSKQQMIEIAKALSINAKILIMDEPTSALTSREIDELFNIIRKLKSQGCGIVYISHRLEELAHITDRVTIMRDGHYITEGNFTDFTMDEIIANMVGREIKEKFPHVECEKGKKVFEVKNLNAGRLVRDINFSLYEGEIVGFAGLMGAGRTETTRAIFGVDPKESGTLILDGKEIPGWKAVEGKSNRAFTDESAAIQKLKDSGYEEEKLYKPKEALSLSNLEKLVGKKKFAELVGEFITKPHGKPTLASENDKRAAYSPASVDLGGVIITPVE